MTQGRPDLERQASTIQRLRELHRDAVATDQPRAALLLGLAITDYVAALPDGVASAELVAEGVSRLEEAGDSSPATVAARTLLIRFLPLSQGPDSFEMRGGDLDWEVDWEAVQGPSQAARNMTQFLPTLAAMLPPEDPMRVALEDVIGVFGAFERGQWTPEADVALTSAIRRGGLGAGVGLMLRLFAMSVRVERCRLAEQQGSRPDWPELAEMDALIEEIASVGDEFAGSFEGPFQDMAGMEHLFFATLVTMRLHVDTRRTDVPRDSSWRDGILELLDQVDDHLSKAPAAYAGLVRRVSENNSKLSARLKQWTSPPTSVASQAPPAPSAAASPVPASPVPTSPQPMPGDPGLPSQRAASYTLDGPLSRIATPELSASFRLLAQFADDAVMTGLAHLTVVMQAIIATRWTAEADKELDALRQEVADLESAGGTTLADRAMLTAMLAYGRFARWSLLSQSPRLTERPPGREIADLLAEAESAIELLSQASAQDPSSAALAPLGAIMHLAAASLLTALRSEGDGTPDAGLAERAREHMAQVPDEMVEQMPSALSDALALQRIAGEGNAPEPAEAERLARRFGEFIEVSGAGQAAAVAAAAEARKSQDVTAIGVALDELNKLGIALPSGSPVHARRLILLAEMQTMLASQTDYRLGLVDAISSAIEAAGLASEDVPPLIIARQFLIIFSLMSAKGEREGPFDQAEQCLMAMLSQAGADDLPLRVVATTAMAAVTGLRARACDDQDLRDAAMRHVADAEKLLADPVPTGDWYEVARAFYTWMAVQAVHGPDPGLVPVALRLGDQLAGVLASNPKIGPAMAALGYTSATDEPASGEQQFLRDTRVQLLALAERKEDSAPAATTAPGDAREARQRACDSVSRSATVLGRTGQDGTSRRPLAPVGRPDPAALRDLMTDLHAARASAFLDVDLRRTVEEALGLCAAELYWADPAARTAQVLREAIVHLNRALTSGRPALPSTERADNLDVLARCRQEVALRHEDEQERARARIEADRAARAAVRELARCVLLAADTGQALEVAARANEVVARSIGWCLADGQDRAAVELAESGRGLVLISVVLAGQVEEVLRGAGQGDLAEAWRLGGEEGKLAALDALWGTNVGLLAAPTADRVSIMLTGTNFDAVVYLVPPVAPDGNPDQNPNVASGPPGYAILVRPLLSQIEVLELSGLGGPAGEPLQRYLSALDGALASFGTNVPGGQGFRGGPGGPAWADALVTLGSWAYDKIMGPLIEHVRRWDLDHRPRLALIPLGELAAVPYAAAWTIEATDSRRYVIDDVVLTYAASARLLDEVSRRQPQPLARRVVLMTDPDGGFPMTRSAARLLASRQYRRAEVYGLASAPNGPATTEVLLSALPGIDQSGASLLQLSTHGRAEPAGLRTFNGWLHISRVLEQARGRPPESPGGMIITNACLTDATRVNYDESLTLATAFLAAGATAVIGTRWPVDDDTTSALSLRLHYHLQLGKSAAEALRCAQLDLLRPSPSIRRSLGTHLAAVAESRLSHPASWAGYVHHGSDAPAE